MVERIDELEKYYSPIETSDSWASFLFYLGALFSITIPYSNLIQIPWIEQAISALFIVIVVSHSVVSHYSGFHLIPIAENLRRKQLLSNSLGIPLTTEKTHLYYNNEVSPSVIRLGANVTENSFFAKNVCSEMAKNERIKIFIYALVWLFSIANRSTDLNIILTLTQVLFSGDILIRWLKLEILRTRNESIYNQLYSLFLNKSTSTTVTFVAGILDAFASYEAAKASASIKQSSRIFNKLNKELTVKWNEIKAGLRIGEIRA